MRICAPHSDGLYWLIYLKGISENEIGLSSCLKEMDSDITILVPVSPIDDTHGGSHYIHGF